MRFVPPPLSVNGVVRWVTCVTRQAAPALLETGMITDGRWVDYDGDQDPDLCASRLGALA